MRQLSKQNYLNMNCSNNIENPIFFKKLSDVVQRMQSNEGQKIDTDSIIILI